MKLLCRRNRKKLMSKLSKMVTLMVIIVVILGSSLQPAAAQTATNNGIISDKIIGIDLGTTQSVVSFNIDGKTIIIPNEQGNRITPSIVGFTASEILVGDPAYNQMSKNPKNTIFDVKRFIGRDFNDPKVQQDIKLLPFEVINKNNKPYFTVHYKGERHEFSAEQISAMVLKKLKQTAEAYLGGEIKKAVITVPAYFDDTQKQATKDAGTIAGLDVVRIINEPTSAAIAYGIDKRMVGESNIIVYDVGGGTFDVSLLTLDEGIFEVEATGGDTHLGGEDFDENVIRFMIKQFKKKHNLDLSQNARALSKLRKECEKAKRALSSSKQTKIEIENIMNGIDFSEMLTRARFEDLNNKLFRATLKPLAQVLKDSGLKKNEINEIVLVGGSTRIPKIQQLVRDFFNGKEVNRGINPDEAVAEGAAIQACIIGGYCDSVNIVVMDITPLSLGIETVGGIMTKIVPRGSKIPTYKTQIFSTHMDNQKDVLIQIFQGERAETKHNRKLGDFMLSGIPEQPRGVPQIEVQFDIDTNGILQVEAFEKTMGENNKEKLIIKRDDHQNLSQDDIDEAISEFEKFAADDEKLLKRTQARNRLESDVFGLKSKLYDKQNEMSENDYDMLMELCTEMNEWIDNNTDDAEYEDYIEKQQEFDEIVSQTFSQNQNSHDNDDNDDHFDHEDL